MPIFKTPPHVRGFIITQIADTDYDNGKHACITMLCDEVEVNLFTQQNSYVPESLYYTECIGCEYFLNESCAGGPRKIRNNDCRKSIAPTQVPKYVRKKIPPHVMQCSYGRVHKFLYFDEEMSRTSPENPVLRPLLLGSIDDDGKLCPGDLDIPHENIMDWYNAFWSIDQNGDYNYFKQECSRISDLLDKWTPEFQQEHQPSKYTTFLNITWRGKTGIVATYELPPGTYETIRSYPDALEGDDWILCSGDNRYIRPYLG